MIHYEYLYIGFIVINIIIEVKLFIRILYNYLMYVFVMIIQAALTLQHPYRPIKGIRKHIIQILYSPVFLKYLYVFIDYWEMYRIKKCGIKALNIYRN